MHRHDHARRLGVVLGIGAGVFLIELAGGLLANSLALLADAAHVFADMWGVGLALIALRVARRPGGELRTFGFHRIEILAAVANALILFGIAAFIGQQAFTRLSEPPEVTTAPMLLAASLSLGANLVSAWLLRDAQHASLNLRGAFLEVLSDAAGAAAVLVAAVVIAFTGIHAADAIASLAIGVLILPRTWLLLREALDILLESAPAGVDMNDVRRHILEAKGVTDVHDLHAWTITSGMHVVSAHVVVAKSADPGAVLDDLSRCLSSNFDIEHSTFQLESEDRRRLETTAHL